jgi:hypothetical protein
MRPLKLGYGNAASREGREQEAYRPCQQERDRDSTQAVFDFKNL